MPEDGSSGLPGALPRALRWLRERAGVSSAALEAWEIGEASPSFAELTAWLEALGFDLRDLQDALDEVSGRSGETLPRDSEPHPVEAFWVATRHRLELDPAFREQVRELAGTAELGDVLRRLERLESRLERSGEAPPKEPTD